MIERFFTGTSPKLGVLNSARWLHFNEIAKYQHQRFIESERGIIQGNIIRDLFYEHSQNILVPAGTRS